MFTIDTWNKVANAVYLISVPLAAVASVAIYQISNRIGDIKDAELQRFKIKAEADISAANERSSALEKEAEQARLDQEKLKAATAWRSIGQQQAKALENAATQIRGQSINLRFTDGDPESLFLAIQIGNILSKAGWSVAPGAIKFQNALMFGVSLSDDVGGRVATALRDASIQFSTGILPEGIGILTSKIEGAPTLMIGSRQPVSPR